MEWLEISIDAPDRDTEALCALLDCLGVEGLVIEDEKDIESFLRDSGTPWTRNSWLPGRGSAG